MKKTDIRTNDDLHQYLKKVLSKPNDILSRYLTLDIATMIMNNRDYENIFGKYDLLFSSLPILEREKIKELISSNINKLCSNTNQSR